MITAQDIREKCFEKARIGGYAMDEVDDFLDELANDAAASQKEIATLNAKMKYLADKIREIGRGFRKKASGFLLAHAGKERFVRTDNQAAQMHGILANSLDHEQIVNAVLDGLCVVV